jgi:hypothetical protein
LRQFRTPNSLLHFAFKTAGLGQHSVGAWVKNSSAATHLRAHSRGERAELAFSFDFSNANGLMHLIQMSVGQLLNAMGVMLENAGQKLSMHFRQERPAGSSGHGLSPMVCRSLTVTSTG